MNKHDDIKLDVTSNIDEKIVDEVTDKKIALLNKSNGKIVTARKRYITIIAIAATLALLIGVLMIIFIPLLTSDVPVYKGMTIRNSSETIDASEYEFEYSGLTFISSRTSISSKIEFLDESSISPNTAANGHHKEHDDQLEKDIKDLVTIDVVTDEEVRYYVKPGETFIIEIHIDNPKDYEIQSFTLNGQKYANYMFKEGSTMELLLLEVTAPSEPGYVEYTIDAIKYIDGTEIKDVDMSSGDKSIKAGIAYPTAPKASVTSQSITPTSIELSINVEDKYSIIGENELAVYLTDGIKVVDKKDLTVGNNTVKFEGLSMSTPYAYGVATTYDMADGNNLQKVWLLSSTVTTASAFAINNATPTQSSISFELEQIEASGKVTSISLYDNITDELVELAGADTREFTGLLSNHSYDLYVDFTYTSDSGEITDWVAIKDIKTIAKTEPTVTFGNVSSNKTSVSYAVETVDPDGILKIQKVELLKNGAPVKDNNTGLVGTFDALLSNNTYTVSVTYSYDLGDGQGDVRKTATKNITTVAKASPTISFSGISATDTTVSGAFSMTDTDSIGSISSVGIYKNGTLVESSTSNKIEFSGLESYTKYSIVVTYTFDLNDGAGLQTKTATRELNTAPHLAFKSCDIINTNAVSVGQTIYMQLELDNPSGAIPSSVVINGRKYDCTAASTPDMIFAEIVNNGQFEGGETTLTVETVSMTLGGKTYTVTATQNNSDKIFIYGKLEAESLSVAVLKDGNYTEVYYTFPSDQAYLMITLNNKTGYEITSVTISKNEYTELTKIDNDHYVLTMPEGTGTHPNYKLTQIKYEQGSTEATITPSSVSCRVVKLSSEEIKYISTPEDLLSMNGNEYYELTNDIDLAGIEWHGNNFVGVFNGNGHSINNMSFVGTITDQTAQLGLFTSSSGVIQDLHMNGIRFIVNQQSTVNKDYSVIYGSIAACSGGTVFMNCSVDKTSYISVNGDGVDDGYDAVGGIVGSSSGYDSWINCQNYATISSNVSAVGGIVGKREGNTGRVMFKQCANYSSVTGQHIVGGIIGDGSGVNVVNGGDILEDCANYGSVTGTDFVGGIAGYYNSKSFVNCFNAGTVTDTYADNYSTFAGGIVGIGGTNTILENCVNVGTVMAHGWNQCIFGNVDTGTNDTTDFSWMDNFVNCHALGDNESVEMLNSKTFYTDTLGWSEDVWNLDDLDIENGKYPTLK